MNVILTLPLTIFLLLLARKIWSLFGRSWTSPLRFLPGPKSASYFYGNFLEINQAQHSVLFEKWVGLYGKTFKYHHLGNVSHNHLHLSPAQGLLHILGSSVIHDGHSCFTPRFVSLRALLQTRDSAGEFLSRLGRRLAICRRLAASPI